MHAPQMRRKHVDMHITRRRMLKMTSALACAPAVPSAHATGRPLMLQRPIPKTAEQLPVVGIGTWQTFDVGNTRPELDPRKEVLDTLFNAGGRVIDSSPMYGRAEAAVGTLLTEMNARDKAFTATKVCTTAVSPGIVKRQSTNTTISSPDYNLIH